MREQDFASNETASGAEPPALPQTPEQAEAVLHIRSGLEDNLSPLELEELDAIITPRAAELLVKAFGPGMWEILGPLVREDDPDELARAEASLREMMRDPRYWRDRSPQAVQSVADGFNGLYVGGEG